MATGRILTCALPPAMLAGRGLVDAKAAVPRGADLAPAIPPAPVVAVPPQGPHGASRVSKRWAFTCHKFPPFPVWDANSMDFLIGQEEEAPLTKKHHLQCYCHFKARIGFKKAMQLLGIDGAHMEIARGTEEENEKYCEKEESRVQDGWHIREGKMVKAGERVDLTAVKDKIAAGAKFIDLTEDPDDIKVCARYGHFVEKLIAIHKEKRGKTDMAQLYEDVSLRPWQAEFLENIDEEPDPRAVYWVVDAVGNSGKSWLCQYLRFLHHACVLVPGKLADMAYLYAQHEFDDDHPKIVCFDCSRTTAKETDDKYDPLTPVYSLIESLKNGCVQSTKYQPVCVFGPRHVLGFSNFMPDQSKLSLDRWRLFELMDGALSVVHPIGSGAVVAELSPQESSSLVYHPL